MIMKNLIIIEKAVNHRDTEARSLKVREKAGMHPSPWW